MKKRILLSTALLAVTSLSASFATEAQRDSLLNQAGEKISNASDAVATSSKKAYYNAKDAVTPEASDKVASAAKDTKKAAKNKLNDINN